MGGANSAAWALRGTSFSLLGNYYWAGEVEPSRGLPAGLQHHSSQTYASNPFSTWYLESLPCLKTCS